VHTPRLLEEFYYDIHACIQERPVSCSKNNALSHQNASLLSKPTKVKRFLQNGIDEEENTLRHPNLSQIRNHARWEANECQQGCARLTGLLAAR